MDKQQKRDELLSVALTIRQIYPNEITTIQSVEAAKLLIDEVDKVAGVDPAEEASAADIAHMAQRIDALQQERNALWDFLDRMYDNREGPMSYPYGLFITEVRGGAPILEASKDFNKRLREVD